MKRTSPVQRFLISYFCVILISQVVKHIGGKRSVCFFNVCEINIRKLSFIVNSFYKKSYINSLETYFCVLIDKRKPTAGVGWMEFNILKMPKI